MALIVGADDGLYRTPAPQFDTATKLSATGRVARVRQFAAVEGVFAATKTGLYRSVDGGETWTDLAVPREEVYSVCAGPAGERLYAGTHPAHIYTRSQAGAWQELTGFQELPSRPTWHTPRHRNEAHVCSLGIHHAAPDRIVARVEVGGVHLIDDRGRTWQERRDGLHNDVHHLLCRGPGTFIAACGGGLYRTDDAGQTWQRLAQSADRQYFRESIATAGRLYTAASRGPPGTWDGASGADAALYVLEADTETVTRVSYPGGPREIILAWAVADGTVIAGTNAGRVLYRSESGWKTGGHVPTGIRSLTAV